MPIAEAGKVVVLPFKARDADTGLFPQATIRDSAGAQVAGSPVNLAHIASGYYTGLFTVVGTGVLTVTTTVYTQAYGNTESNFYGPLIDQIDATLPSISVKPSGIDTAQVTAAVINAVRDAILSDATRFAGASVAHLNADVSSRAVAGDAMALTPSERISVQAKILSDATPFPGARIDAAISSIAGGGALASQASVNAVQASVDTKASQASVDAITTGGSLASQASVDAVQVVVDEINASVAPLLVHGGPIAP